MLNNFLPKKVDPFRSAEQGLLLKGEMLLTEMKRISSHLSSDNGSVLVTMEFGIDEQGIKFVRGNYQATLLLVCQRCLEPFTFSINNRFLCGLVHSEKESDTLPRLYEPIIVEERSLLLLDVIEDELIIHLPVVPMHRVDECKRELSLPVASGSTDKSDTENPFKVIELLRSKK